MAVADAFIDLTGSDADAISLDSTGTFAQWSADEDGTLRQPSEDDFHDIDLLAEGESAVDTETLLARPVIAANDVIDLRSESSGDMSEP
jgi:hypothetical protein